MQAEEDDDDDDDDDETFGAEGSLKVCLSVIVCVRTVQCLCVRPS